MKKHEGRKERTNVYIVKTRRRHQEWNRERKEGRKEGRKEWREGGREGGREVVNYRFSYYIIKQFVWQLMCNPIDN